MTPAYTYSANINEIDDSGRITAILDLGFGQTLTQTMRLNMIVLCSNGKGRKYIEDWVVNRPSIIKVIKNELGYCAEVFFSLHGKDINLVDQLLLLGHARLLVS